MNPDAELKAKMGDLRITETNFDEFQSGTKSTRFDFVLAYVFHEYDADELEMMEEYYQNYAVAPVFVWIAPSSNESAAKSLKENSIFVACNSADEIVQKTHEAIDQAKTKIQKVVSDEIKPAFSKVDKDGSGAIDKSELAELAAGLGQTLDEEQL